MACQTLVRRKTQLALLARACGQHVPAYVRLRRRASVTGQARLAALKPDEVRMDWTGKRLKDAERPGRPVEVHFELEGEHYTFFATSRGRGTRAVGGEQKAGLLRLGLPLSLERVEPRRRLRLALEGLPPITAVFTHVVDGRRQFSAQLTDISEGGVGVAARTAAVSRLCTSDLFWMNVEPPGEKERAEVLVRLVHLRPIKHTDRLAMGWAFQPGDDDANVEKCLRKLEAFVARQRPGPRVGETR